MIASLKRTVIRIDAQSVDGNHLSLIIPVARFSVRSDEQVLTHQERGFTI